jgi:cytidylate kinase
MKQDDAVRQFLKDRTTDKGIITGYPFVTISRQAGAGGHILARQIVRALEKKFTYEAASEWEVFDQKICALLAADGNIKMSFDALVTEEYKSEIQQFIGDMISGQPRQYKVYRKIMEIVRLLTTMGKVVIVGRAGAFIAKDLPQGVHIRLVAGEKVRIKRMASMLDVSLEEAKRAVKLQDKSRARLVNDYFSTDVSDPVHYHAVFNTELVGIPDIADIVADMVGEKIKAMKKRK